MEEEFSNSLELAKRTKTEQVLGHTVVFSSLSARDVIEAGLWAKTWMGSEYYATALELAQLAASVDSLDGEVLWAELNQNRRQTIEMKASKIWEWPPIFLHAVFLRFTEIQKPVSEAMDRISEDLKAAMSSTTPNGDKSGSAINKASSKEKSTKPKGSPSPGASTVSRRTKGTSSRDS
jgi:hypothetical protein